MSSTAAALTGAAEQHDWDAAAEIVDTSWIDLTLTGHLDALGRVVAQMPEPVLRRSPTAGLIAENVGRLEPGATPYQLPEERAQLEALGRSPEAHRELVRSLAAMAARRRRGEHADALEFVRRGEVVADAAEFVMFPDVDGLRPLWLLQAGITAHLAGDQGLARRLHRAAYRARERSRFDIVGRDAAGNMALIEATAGHLVEADGWLERARSEEHGPTWVAPLIDTPITAAAGLVACDRLDHQGVRHFVRTAASAIDHDEHWPSLLRARVDIEITFGHVATAWQVIEQARDSHERWTGPDGYGTAVLARCQADVALAAGRGVPAARALEQLDAGDPHGVVARARLALLSGAVDDADLIARKALADTTLTLRDRLDLLVLAAAIAERQDRRPLAVERISVAVDLSATTGAVRPFASVPRAVLRALSPAVPGLESVLEALRAAGARDIYPSSIGTVEVTERELDLLRQLDSADPLPEIARRMSLSVNTVRTHLASLRRKLGAHSRDEVVARARRHGLLD